MKRLFIGMPVYNGEKFIEAALNSICAQTFKDWELLISDNHSDDRTQEICLHFSQLDPRIKYVRQSENIGAIRNFKYLLDKADHEFFMWASSDDEWCTEFVASGINKLDFNSKCGLAFSNMINIDSLGNENRAYLNFTRFRSSSDKTQDIVSYFVEPEAFGKANLIYGIFRLEICRRAWEISPFGTNPNVWGSDYIFNLGVITLADIAIDERILFKKRMTNEEMISDSGEVEKKARNAWDQIFPYNVADDYLKSILIIFNNSNLKELIIHLMKLRCQISEKIELVEELNRKNESLLREINRVTVLNEDLREQTTKSVFHIISARIMRLITKDSP